jgi:glycosyltransferase involved in cell wall biosynthesis
MIENMIIGMIGEYPPFYSGGIATHMKEIVKILSKKNRIIVITPSPKASLEVFNNIEVHRVKAIRKKHLTTLTTILSPTIKALKLRNKIDLLHCHSLLSPVGHIAKKLPIVITVHGYASLETSITGRIKQNSIQFKLLREIEKTTARRADAIIAVDSTIENWLKEDLKIDENKVYCIPNGVDTQQFSPAADGKEIRIKYGIKDNEGFIVTIRKFTPKNRVETILEGFILLKKSYNFENVKLLLAGGGELKEKFARMILENKLGNSVILEDAIPHKEVPKYFSAADIIANSFAHISGVKEFEASSLLEALEKARPIGTSITTLEALSSGKATVVSTPGGIFKGVTPNDIGVLTPGNPKILAEAMARLLNDRKLLETIGKNGREYVEKNRKWSIIVEKISKVYQSVISKKR